MESKYVVMKHRVVDAMGDPVEDSNGKFITKEIIYVFPNDVVHAMFASKHGGSKNCVGAGFIGMQNNGKHFCHGKSESLGISSRVADTSLLQILLGEF